VGVTGSIGDNGQLSANTPTDQKRADLVKGDPAARIADIENVEIVFKDGIGYDSRRLIESVRGQVGIR
jgi:hypothetical protein